MSNSNDTNNFGSPGNMDDDEFNISPRANNYKQNVIYPIDQSNIPRERFTFNDSGYSLKGKPLDKTKEVQKDMKLIENLVDGGHIKAFRVQDLLDNISDPKVQKILNEFETNGDGKLDPQELGHLLEEVGKQRDRNDTLKKVSFCVFVVLIILLAGNTALTFMMLKLTKEVYVSSGDSAMTTINGAMVLTDKPRVYTMLADIPKLPITSLNSMSQLTFTTVDGRFHNYAVQGFQFESKGNETAIVYFTTEKQLYISPEKLQLRSIDTSGRVLSATDVIQSASPKTRRLVQIVESYISTGRDVTDLQNRCSDSKKFCYHTYEEIVALHEPDLNMISNGRNLELESPDSISYAEINLDKSVLTKGSKSNLESVSAFIDGIMSSMAPTNSTDTLVITLTMRDRCTNYPPLADLCRFYPAPVNTFQSSNIYAPFIGVVGFDGKWFFEDEIIYSQDSFTMKLEVRYSHDIKKDHRVHTVIIEIANPDKIISYDNVSTFIDPSDETYSFRYQKYYIVNYKEGSSAGSTDDFLQNSGNINTRSRRSLAEKTLLNHIRTSIPSFPDIYISEEEIHLGMMDSNNIKRKLDEGKIVNIEPSLTSDGAYCAVPNYEGGNSVASYLPCLSNSTQSPDLQEPTSYFTYVNVGRLPGIIRWPSPSEAVKFQEFDKCPILQRSHLKFYKDLHSFYAPINYTLNGTNRKSFKYNSGSRQHMNSLSLQSKSKNPMLRGPFNNNDHLQVIAMSIASKDKLNGHFSELQDLFIQIKNTILIAQAYVIERELEISNAKSRRLLSGINGEDLHNLRVAIKEKKMSLNSLVAVTKLYGLTSTIATKLGLVSTPIQSTSSDPNFNTGYSYSVAAPGVCAAFSATFDSSLDIMINFKNFVARLNDYISSLNSKLGYPDNISSILGVIVNIDTVISKLIPFMSKIPYVGPIIQQFFNYIFHPVVLSPVKPTKDEIDKLKLTISNSKVKDKLTKMSDFLDKVEISLQAFIASSDKLTGLLLVDKYCPVFIPSTSMTATATICKSLNLPLVDLNLKLKAINAFFVEYIGFFSEITMLFDLITDFMNSIDMGVFDILALIFNSIMDLLNQTISICIPWICYESNKVCVSVDYPCGVIVCSKKVMGITIKYPCGTNTCSKEQCTEVPVPVACEQCTSFTMMELIDGVMSTLSIVMDALNSLMAKLASLLNIPFPTITLPGLPTPDFITKIGDILSSLFDDLFVDINFVNLFRNFDAIIALLDFQIPQIDAICINP